MKKFITINLLILLVAIPIIAGCKSEVYSLDNFVDDLLDSGASVQIGESTDHSGKISPFLANTKNNIKVNGENVNVYEYDNEALAEEDAALIDPDGFGMSRIDESGSGIATAWGWIGPPHFYKKDRIIVEYIDISRGSDPTVRIILESILGTQFAGAPTIIPISISSSPNAYITNKQEVYSEVLLKSIQVNEGISDEQYISFSYPSQTVNVGELILIVRGTIQNKHKKNIYIRMWAEGYDEIGEQVSWTLDAAHPFGCIALTLETDETSEFVIHLNYSEDVSSINIYANNYPVPPP